jgi:hypothetical protein
MAASKEIDRVMQMRVPGKRLRTYERGLFKIVVNSKEAVRTPGCIIHRLVHHRVPERVNRPIEHEVWNLEFSRCMHLQLMCDSLSTYTIILLYYYNNQCYYSYNYCRCCYYTNFITYIVVVVAIFDIIAVIVVFLIIVIMIIIIIVLY